MGARVLVVDDERVVSEVVEQYLRREGFDVALASDGGEALRLAQEWAPDLVVLDLMLPVVDGLEVCRQLRQESQVPIIMLTARGEETDRVVGLELGADDYVVKPFSPRELVARVKTIAARSGRTPIGARPPADARITATSWIGVKCESGAGVAGCLSILRLDPTRNGHYYVMSALFWGLPRLVGAFRCLPGAREGLAAFLGPFSERPDDVLAILPGQSFPVRNPATGLGKGVASFE